MWLRNMLLNEDYVGFRERLLYGRFHLPGDLHVNGPNNELVHSHNQVDQYLLQYNCAQS